MLLVGPRRDRPVLSLALGDALTVGQPPPASEVHQHDSAGVLSVSSLVTLQFRGALLDAAPRRVIG